MQGQKPCPLYGCVTLGVDEFMYNLDRRLCEYKCFHILLAGEIVFFLTIFVIAQYMY